MYPPLISSSAALLLFLIPLAACAGTAASERRGAAEPELPREYVDTSLTQPTGHLRRVPAGEDLQETLELAQLGDVIVLEAGAVYKGPFTLPNKKEGSGWITIRTSAIDRLPGPGTRTAPSHAPLMPKLTSRRGGGVILAEKGAHHYRFIGVEITPHEDTYLYSLMWLGYNNERSLEELPHHIVVDRCYIHGDPKKGSRRGVALNGRHLAVIDSHVSDFKEEGGDSQALIGWGGLGPIKIVNNYLEGAGENVMFGGGDPSIRDLVPSDIEIRHNYMTKPLSWKRGEPGYDGSKWTIKNLFELKNARRVLVDGNVLEYSWEESQSGFAVLLTVRNQDGHAPWSAVEDVRFTNNVIRHSGSGITLMGHDNNQPWDRSQETKRILIKNNLWEDIGGPRWGGRGILFQLVEGTSDVAIEQNTGRQTGYLVYAEGPPHKRFVFKGNVGPHNEFGIYGRALGTGVKALNGLFPDSVVVDNVIAGGDPRQYPDGNVFPNSLDAAPSVNAKTDRQAAAEAGVRTAVNKRGVDAGALCAALGGETVRAETVCPATRFAGTSPQ
ncbi:MAG TPA: hypothetical protein VJ746_11305 [Nitrospira sp.]|nr:hypothetical protein [Nitrospira sp.]